MTSSVRLPNIDVPLKTRTRRVSPTPKRQGYLSFNPILYLYQSLDCISRVGGKAVREDKTLSSGKEKVRKPDGQEKENAEDPESKWKNFDSLLRVVELQPQVPLKEHAWIICAASAATALFSTLTDFVVYWRRTPPAPPGPPSSSSAFSFSFLNSSSSTVAFSFPSATSSGVPSGATLPFSTIVPSTSMISGTPTTVSTSSITALPTSSLTSSQMAARAARNEQPHRLLPVRTAAEWWLGLQAHLCNIAPGHFWRSAVGNISELSLYALIREQIRVLLAIWSSGECLTSPYVVVQCSSPFPVDPFPSHPSSLTDNVDAAATTTTTTSSSSRGSRSASPLSQLHGGRAVQPSVISTGSFSFFLPSHFRNPNLWCGVGGGALGGALCAAVAHPFQVLDTTVRLECVRIPVLSPLCSRVASGVPIAPGEIPSSRVKATGGVMHGGTVVQRRFKHVGEVIMAALRSPPPSSSASSSFLERWRKFSGGLRQGRRMAMIGGAVHGGVRFGGYELLREDGVYRHAAVLFFYCWLSSFAGLVCQYPCRTLRQYWHSAVSLPSPVLRRESGKDGKGRHQQRVTYRSVLRELRRTGGISQLWLHFFSSRPMLCSLPSAFLLFSYDCLMRQEAEGEREKMMRKLKEKRRGEQRAPWEVKDGVGVPLSSSRLMSGREMEPTSFSSSFHNGVRTHTTASVDQSLTAMKTASQPLPSYEFRPPSRRALP